LRPSSSAPGRIKWRELTARPGLCWISGSD
jgi:hypothetical protein